MSEKRPCSNLQLTTDIVIYVYIIIKKKRIKNCQLLMLKRPVELSASYYCLEKVSPSAVVRITKVSVHLHGENDLKSRVHLHGKNDLKSRVHLHG